MPDQAKGMRALSDHDLDVVQQCLRAAVEGPFFPEWEFHTIFGVEREVVAAVLARWPQIDDSLPTDRLAVNNTLANLLGYPHGCEARWSEFIQAPPSEVSGLLVRWRGAIPRNYLDALE